MRWQRKKKENPEKFYNLNITNMEISKAQDLLEDIETDADTIERDASELREMVSQLELHNEDEFTALIDGIKGMAKSIAKAQDKCGDEISDYEEECNCEEESFENYPRVECVLLPMGELFYLTNELVNKELIEAFTESIYKLPPYELIEKLKAL